jgi:hypothetical protein
MFRIGAQLERLLSDAVCVMGGGDILLWSVGRRKTEAFAAAAFAVNIIYQSGAGRRRRRNAENLSTLRDAFIHIIIMLYVYMVRLDTKTSRRRR